MSATSYCVDGTNLVRTSCGYGGPQFRRQEEADAQRLVEGLSRVCEALGGRVEIEVFFDGGDQALRAHAGAANLRVRFAREIEADELILDRVRSRSWSGGGRVTVVTADGELGRRAEEEGGRWLKVRHGSDMIAVFKAIEGRFSR